MTTTYHAEIWDADCEEWERYDAIDAGPRHAVESDIAYAKRRSAVRIKLRVVPGP